MVESENSDDMTDKIKLFNSDESLKLLGELLSNKSSRDIIGLLIEKEMYKNAIATKLNLRLNLVSHHLEKMESIGLVEISHKKIIRKGDDHKFFRINPKIFLMPNYSEKEIKEKGILKRIFKDGIKFASIGLATFSLGIITNFVIKNQENKIQRGSNEVSLDPNGIEMILSMDVSLVIAFISGLGALSLFVFFYLKKKN